MVDAKKVIPSCSDGKAEPTEAGIPGERVKVWVGYDENGDIIEVKPGLAAECFEELKEELSVDDLKILADKTAKPNVDVKTTTFIRLWSNPSCWVFYSGRWYYVC